MRQNAGWLRRAIESRAEKGRPKDRAADRDHVYPLARPVDEEEQRVVYESIMGSTLMGVDFQWNAGTWGKP